MFEFIRRKREEADHAHAIAHIVGLKAKSSVRMGVQEFKDFGSAANISPLILHAFFMAESTNSGFGPDGRLTVLPEPHIAYEQARNSRYLHSIAPDLFYPKWGGMKSPVYQLSHAMRWDHIVRAASLDFNGGLCGASYGACQVLGKHWKMLGFASITDMLETMCEGQHVHLEVMIRYLKAEGQVENLRKGNFRPVVVSYNGAGNATEYLRRISNYMDMKRVLYA